LFRSPIVGTVLLAMPGVLLIGLALFFAGGRLGHAAGLFAWGQLPILILSILTLALLALALVTLVRRPEPGGPSRHWGWFPLAFAVGFALFCGFAVMRADLFFADVSNLEKLNELQGANLSTPEDTPITPGEWPQWRGPRRDAISPEQGLNTDWTAKPPKELWRKPIHGGYSSIAVAGGRLYATDRTGSSERVLCRDGATGEDLWIHEYPADYRGVEYDAGPRATPTVHDGRVYTVGGTGIFLCLEAAPAGNQPKVLWQHNLMQEYDATPPRWGVACSPLIEGNLVIVQPGGSKGSVVAFDRITGQPVWAALDDPSGYSSPIVATLAGVRQIVAFTGKGIAGLRASDGQQLWYYPWETQFGGNIATPIAAGNYVFISSGYNKGCVLLEIQNAGPGISAEAVYQKSNKLMRNHHSSCVLVDGFLYGFDCGPELLKCVDLRTAEEKWITRKIGKGSVFFADGHLIILTEHGLLAIADASPAGYHETGRLQVFDSAEVWALPTLASGKLYLRDKHEMVCLDLSK
jgi:outer membrane protein assembly factor BamB